MEQYQKILTVIDPTVEDQKALKRAIELPQKTKASITAFLTIFDETSMFFPTPASNFKSSSDLSFPMLWFILIANLYSSQSRRSCVFVFNY